MFFESVITVLSPFLGWGICSHTCGREKAARSAEPFCPGGIVHSSGKTEGNWDQVVSGKEAAGGLDAWGWMQMDQMDGAG